MSGPNPMTTMIPTPVPRGPLLEWHRRSAAEFTSVEGAVVALRYPPREAAAGRNVLIDLWHWPAWELGGAQTAVAVRELCGDEVPVRHIRPLENGSVCRLTASRALVFGKLPYPVLGAIDVSGGWCAVALAGPDRERILAKVTALDLRESALPTLGCCQGPVFGVNTLFCRFPDRLELHVCPDSLEFFWEVLLDAGAEFGLQPAGLETYQRLRGTTE